MSFWLFLVLTNKQICLDYDHLPIQQALVDLMTLVPFNHQVQELEHSQNNCNRLNQTFILYLPSWILYPKNLLMVQCRYVHGSRVHSSFTFSFIQDRRVIVAVSDIRWLSRFCVGWWFWGWYCLVLAPIPGYLGCSNKYCCGWIWCYFRM